ncbi:hypothetical protein D3C72_1377110 [compost metagenome]
MDQQQITVGLAVVFCGSHQLIGGKEQHTAFIEIIVILSVLKFSAVLGNKSDLVEAQYIIDRCHFCIEGIVLIEMYKTDQRMLRCWQAKGLVAFRDRDVPDQFVVLIFHFINL